MHNCYVIATEAAMPAHLQDRAPCRFPDTRISYRVDRHKALDSDGRVVEAGAVEFRAGITPGQLAVLCEPTELWAEELSEAERFRSVYDSEIQRGEKGKGSKRVPVLNEKNIQSMIDDIRKNEFECPELMWNVRYGLVSWVYVEDKRELLIFEGVATRPDTNHRHHAIVRMHKTYRKWMRETQDEKMEKYNPKREYALAIYTDSFEGEAHKFFVLNSKGWKVAQGKAHYVASMMNDPHAHSKLARDLMKECGVLGEANVEIVGTTLSKNSAKMVLFYTLVRGLQSAFAYVPTDQNEYSSLLQYLSAFIAELRRVRPAEIALLSVERRQNVRSQSIADQAITWIAYFHLAAHLRDDLSWKDRLDVLAKPYRHSKYQGDLFARKNPLWQARGILAPDPKGNLRVISNRNAQQQLITTLTTIVVPARAAKTTK
jgi:hypothetical protein